MKTLVKLLLLSVCFITNHLIHAQPQLSEIDTVLDYKSRFYKNDTLIAKNQIAYKDSATGLYYYSETEPPERIGKSCFYILKHGLWVYYFDKKWRECNKSNAAFYQLFEYNYDAFIGKAYTFNKKNELLYSYEPYPIYEKEKFDGYLKLTYEKGRISSAEYQRWDSDSLRLKYLNQTFYYPNGTISSHTLNDDINNKYRLMTFDDDSFCRWDLKHDETDWYNIQRKRTKKHIKEIKFIKNANGEKIEIYSKDGVEIKRGAPKNRRCSIFYDTRWWFW